MDAYLAVDRNAVYVDPTESAEEDCWRLSQR
jgi:hypothetical protein